MGYSSWSDEAYRRVSAERAGTEVFRGESSIDPLMDPRKLRVREARDSEHHPESVPIIVAFDVTGSMGHIPRAFAGGLLGKLMRRLVEESWIQDPQLCFAAVGDAVSDAAPLQVGQFESGLEMDMWLTRIWLEGRGGDEPESYLLPHWFAARHTATDAWEKRHRKGYLISIGDAHNKPLNPAQIQRVFGYAPEGTVRDDHVVAAAAERYHLFHVLVGTPSAELIQHWERIQGRGVVVLGKVEAICDLIGVLIAVTEGRMDKATGQKVLEAAGVSADNINRALVNVG